MSDENPLTAKHLFGLVFIVATLYSFTFLPEEKLQDFQDNNTTIWLIGGVTFGTLFFFISELNNAGDNRSYTANIMTDFLAFIGSGWIIHRAVYLGEGVLVCVGVAIFQIHFLQVLIKEGIW